jgi:pimeloyl-ACP methyl ester carboxylesterase
VYVSIGHIGQWIQIDRTDQDNPVLLYLHGGPGGSSRPAATAWKPWSEHFTVVHWDQRGAGRTFGRNGEAGSGPLTIERMVDDGIEVAQFLTRNLRKEKILLVGHSWGSVLAVHMLKRRPKLFSAYVGTGQLVNKQRNEEHNHTRLLAEAKRLQNDEALLALMSLEPPLHTDRSKMKILRQWADQLADGNGDAIEMRPHPAEPTFTAEDRAELEQGIEFSRNQLLDQIGAVDLPSLGLKFEMPMFFFHGTADQQTPIELAEQYFADISAPHKEFVRFDRCHHFLVMNRPDDFLRELLTRVRPLLQVATTRLDTARR